MEQAQLIGYVVIAIITLGSFIAVITKFTQPINELKIVIQKLNDTIDVLRSDNDNQNKRLDRHRAEIEDLQIRTSKIETKMEIYKENNKK